MRFLPQRMRVPMSGLPLGRHGLAIESLSLMMVVLSVLFLLNGVYLHRFKPQAEQHISSRDTSP